MKLMIVITILMTLISFVLVFYILLGISDIQNNLDEVMQQLREQSKYIAFIKSTVQQKNNMVYEDHAMITKMENQMHELLAANGIQAKDPIERIGKLEVNEPDEVEICLDKIIEKFGREDASENVEDINENIDGEMTDEQIQEAIEELDNGTD